VRAGDIVADRFEIRDLAGSGGMGEVFRAHDRLTGEPVALKVLRWRGRHDTSRFTREAVVLAELRHPAIVRYVAHGETAFGEMYLAMEWLTGTDLATRLAASALDVVDAVSLVRRAAEGLGCAHARGIVHRDIKPTNLFLEEDRPDRVKLLDFGLARLIDASEAYTEGGRGLGTPGFIAPEQAMGERRVDARADVFVLGCVLYQCLTGRPAFHGKRLAAVLMKVLHDDPPRARDLAPRVPAPLSDLIARMLAKSPDARPRDGAAVVAELDALGPLDDGRAEAASLRPPSLTRAERRLLCFVVAGPSRGLQPTEGGEGDAAAPAREAAEAHGGRIEIVAGGTALVTVPSRGTATDLAAQAARCALGLAAALPDVPVAIAMGRGDASASPHVGETIERAVALLGASRGAPGKIRLDDVSAALLDERFELGADERGPWLGHERELGGRPRTLLGRATPFVGRRRELETLEAIFDECTTEPVARAVLVTAPPGGGKTRLCFELMRSLAERATGAETWIGRGDPLGAGSPFGLIGRTLQSAARIAHGDPLEARRQKLRARVERRLSGAVAARVTERLGELAGAPFPAGASAELDAARREPARLSDDVRRAFEELLAAECAAHPVVIVLEDLQWGDLPSVKLVEGALRHLSDRPLMVLATGRPGVHDAFPKLWSQRGVQEIRLSDLTQRSCEALVRAVLGEAPSHVDVSRLVQRSAGNAFFLEELVRAFAEGREGALPETVLATVQARLERLDPEARRVLRAASVFGVRFPAAGVGALLGGPLGALDVDGWLAELVDAELLDAQDGGAPRELAFRQATVREAAYAMLTEADRRLGHRLAGAWLAESPGADAAVLAEHFDRGGEPERAASCYLAGAEAALLGGDRKAAAERAARGAACGAGGETLGALRAAALSANVYLGEPRGAASFGVEALSLLPTGSSRWCAAAAAIASLATLLADPELLERAAGPVLGAPPDETTRDAHRTAAATIAAVAGRLGQNALGATFLARAEALAAQRAPGNASAEGWLALARAARAADALAEPWSHREAAEAAVESFERAGAAAEAGESRTRLAAAALAMGAYGEAEALLREVIPAADRGGIHFVAALGGPLLGLALARRGAFEEARSLATRAIEAGVTRGARYVESAGRAALARIHLAAGDLRAAEREARAAALGRDLRTPAEVEALATLAVVHLAEDRAREALEAARAAMAWLEAHGGMGHAEGLVRVVHAEARYAAGDDDGARAALATALARLHERVRSVPDPAARRSFLEAVPENARTLALASAWGIQR
jgi:hypothetical protein